MNWFLPVFLYFLNCICHCLSLCVQKGVAYDFESNIRDAAHVEDKEEVHGSVQAVVAGCGCDKEAVAQEGSQVDVQEEVEVEELQLPCVCKCQEEELNDGTSVGHCCLCS